MEKSIITFSANEQNLQKTGGIGCYASDTVSYIEAHFDLGDNWAGYDSIRAVWFNDYKTISTVLDPDGVCIVPHEVLVSRGKVMVNLVGSVLVSDELKDRLTTFPCEALKVSAKAKISGSETAAVTPSQFEQFVSVVISEVEKVTGMTAQAETLPAGSQATARYENGILYLGIPQGIRGERGETGADGADGNGIASVVYNADYSLTLIFDNGERFTTPPIRGERGPAGADGRDGTDGADGLTPNISIGNVETLEPSEDAYVTRRGTDANPIFDFGIPKGDTGTVPDLDLILPTDTASGDIASITDGQSVVPVKSLKVTLEPIQDLHGYDKPWTAGAGANKWDEEYWVGYWNVNDGSHRTSSGQLCSKNYISVVPNATYYYYKGGGTITGEVLYFDANKNYISNSGAKGNQTFTTPSDCHYIQFNFGDNYGETYNHDIAINYPSSVTTYSPYENICPISGHTECVTHRTGVNVWDEEWEVGTINNTTGLPSSDANNIRAKNYCPCKPNTSYFFYSGSGKILRSYWYDAEQNYISTDTANNAIKASPDNAYYFKVRTTDNYGGTYNHDISINYPSTDHEYHAYNGQSYHTTLGRTVYGGTLDVVSGELVVDWVKHIITGDETSVFSSSLNRLIFINGDLPNPPKADGQIMCNTFESVSSTTTPPEGCVTIYNTNGNVIFRLPSSITTKEDAINYLVSNGTHIVYELATPQTYQLDPQTISLLHGNNNVWSDGSVVMVYNADVQLWVLKQLGTSGTRTLSMTKNTKSEETETKSELTKSDNIQLAED